MKERYLYKAKRTDNGEWVQGYYVNCKKEKTKYDSLIFTDIDCSIPECFEYYDIDENTLCQCTGLKDRNGNLIWENDIVIKSNYNSKRIGIVKYYAPKFALKTKYRRIEEIVSSEKVDTGRECYNVSFIYEVIGNIFDNPELLESEE